MWINNIYFTFIIRSIDILSLFTEINSRGGNVIVSLESIYTVLPPLPSMIKGDNFLLGKYYLLYPT
jgi:hypothetical protein